MLRFLFRLILLAVVVGAAALYWAHGWRTTDARRAEGAGAGALGGMIDRERARQAGAEIAQTIAGGAEKVEAALAETRLTAKIKSKMALDDTISASRLSVETDGTVVTVRGSVDTPAQHERALQLARETDGVTAVVDRIVVSGR